ncbi:methyltransferase, FkbM family [Andreprevotia lacus DSM 23236]|jgi:FkbM family methyltransferase|uniref:Methyltransferase, FkbM family n=1 Tax=Andreprevotia lacus DSM 23236 TaxID=1121001 RepID=A0A1W1Y107_9NEIS|nr:FkbM family methyltransferase [Andreprevotia lacus]SMC29804.1 methyltransferase, FkbM family [Andreprevotia lacus DSM 23236]
MLDLSQLGSEAIWQQARMHGVRIFGAGGFARDLARALLRLGIRVHGFVISAQGIQPDVAGLPVTSIHALNEQQRAQPIWLGIFNRGEDADYARIRAFCLGLGLNQLVHPQQYFDFVASEMGWRYWLTGKQDYAVGQSRIEDAIALLEDDASTATMRALLDFRLGHAPETGSVPDIAPQYFPSFMCSQIRAGCNFVDGGAYDGATLAEAARHLSIGQAWAFEPDMNNYRLLANAAPALPFPVTSIPAGLSDAPALLGFNAGGGEASAIGQSGSDRLPVVSLDACLGNAQIDFLKLDVEGHDLPALEGARGLIRKSRPVLALAGYHRWDDIYKIPEFIHSLGMDYKIRTLRHAYNTFDTVFYAY